MTTDQNKEIVTRFNRDIIAGKKAERFDDFFAPDFINRTGRLDYPAGAEGVLKFLQDHLWQGFSDLRVEIHQQIAEGDFVTTRKTIHGRHTGIFWGQPPSNKNISIFTIDIVRLREGKYIEHWGVIDTQSVITQTKI